MIALASFTAIVLATSFHPPITDEPGNPIEGVGGQPPADRQTNLDGALLYHSQCGAIHHVVALLKEGAAPDAADRQGATALQRAAAGGHVEIMKLLISRGADVNNSSKNGRTPLLAAAGSQRAEAVAVLLTAGSIVQPEALGEACRQNHAEVVSMLLEAGAPLNGGIVQASEGGHVELLRRLLDEGADINAQTTYGSTALHGAAANGRVEAVRLLIGGGADLTVKNDRGETALHLAVAGRADLHVIQLLVEAGADIDAINKEGISPIRLAALRGRRKAYEWLLAANGGVERRNSQDQTAPAERSRKTTAELIVDLQSRNYATRQAAEASLLSSKENVIPQVLEAVKNGAGIENFCGLLIRTGTDAQAALPILESKLSDKELAFGVALTMERIKPGAFHDLPDEARKRAAAALSEAVNVPHLDVMEGIQMDFLAKMGEVATPFMLQLLRSDNAEVRAAAAGKFRFDVNQDGAVERELLNILRSDGTVRARIVAARALGKGPHLSDAARAALLATVRQRPPYISLVDGDPETRATGYEKTVPRDVAGNDTRTVEDETQRRNRYELQQLADTAAGSLSKAGPDVIEDLLPLLTPMEAPARPAAIIALRTMGPQAIPRLVDLLGHDDDAVAVAASVALRQMGPPAVAALAEALGSDDQQIRLSAVAALHSMRQGAKAAVPALLNEFTTLENSDVFRVATARAALSIDSEEARRSPAVRSSIPLLIRMLDTGQFEYQGWAAEALGEIGPAAAEALPSLRKRLEVPDDEANAGGRQ